MLIFHFSTKFCSMVYGEKQMLPFQQKCANIYLSVLLSYQFERALFSNGGRGHSLAIGLPALVRGRVDKVIWPPSLPESLCFPVLAEQVGTSRLGWNRSQVIFPPLDLVSLVFPDTHFLFCVFFLT